jgi:hypothetical protein
MLVLARDQPPDPTYVVVRRMKPLLRAAEP